MPFLMHTSMPASNVSMYFIQQKNSTPNRAFHEVSWNRGYGCTQHFCPLFELEVLVAVFCFMFFMKKSSSYHLLSGLPS